MTTGLMEVVSIGSHCDIWYWNGKYLAAYNQGEHVYVADTIDACRKAGVNFAEMKEVWYNVPRENEDAFDELDGYEGLTDEIRKLLVKEGER